jgi:nucleotide-binding universal stress UspA family protein
MSTVAELIKTRPGVSFKRILVATDFSQASEHAVDFALYLARHYDSDLFVVHALEPEPRHSVPLDPLPRELNRERLEAERHMKSLENDPRMKAVTHHVRLRSGKPWEVLAAMTQSEKADLLILGTHGRGYLKKLALGSVSEEVLRQVDCPVITVGPKVILHEIIDCQSILFATDFGPASRKALPYAVSLAQESGAKLVLLHMVPPVTAMQAGYIPAVFVEEDAFQWQATAREESEKKLKELIPSGTLSREPEYIVGLDFMPEGVLSVAAKFKADMIVMGANSTSSPRLAAHLPWAMLHEVVCQSRCPVLTVKG